MFRERIQALESYRNAVRPIILRSLHCVQENFSLNPYTPTYFKDDAEVVRMNGTSMSDKPRDDELTDVGFSDRQYIEVEIDDAEANSELDSSHNHIMNPPFWIDPDSGSMIVPNFVTKKVDVTVNRYCNDRATAERHQKRMESIMKEPHADAFSVSVHYPLPYSVLNHFDTTYQRLVNAGKVDPNVMNSFEWFKSACRVPHDVISNIIGNNACFVFKRSVDTIRLRYDSIKMVKSLAKGRYYGQYLISFKYSFYFVDMVEFELHYPLTVYQQMTDPVWIPKYNPEFFHERPTETYYEQAAARGSVTYNDGLGMFFFPLEDYGRPPTPEYCEPKLQRLALMEDAEEQVVLNLFRFSGKEGFWNAPFKHFIETHPDKITKRGEAPFYLALFAGNNTLDDNDLELMSNGDVIYRKRPEMGMEYRLVFYFDYAIWLWSDENIRDIVDCANESMGRWLMGVLFPYLPLPGDPEYVGLTAEGSCPWIDWERDVEDKVTDRPNNPSTTTDNGIGPPIYMMDSRIIARNEMGRVKDTTLYQTRQSQFTNTILNSTATKFFGRK